jgi:hypothetical protein
LVIQYQPTRDRPRPATKSKTQKLQEQQAQTNREALGFSLEQAFLVAGFAIEKWAVELWFCGVFATVRAGNRAHLIPHIWRIS